MRLPATKGNEVTEIESIVANVNGDARFGTRGITAFAEGSGAKVVRDGRVIVVVAWIGGDEFVVSNEYEGEKWVANVAQRGEVELDVAMTVDALAFA